MHSLTCAKNCVYAWTPCKGRAEKHPDTVKHLAHCAFTGTLRRGFRSAGTPSNPQQILRQSKRNSIELRNEFERSPEGAKRSEGDTRSRFAGKGSPDARRQPGKTERNSENEKQRP